VRTSYSQKGNTSDDTHGKRWSVAVWVDGEIARLGVSILGSVVCHCDYCELYRQLRVIDGGINGTRIGVRRWGIGVEAEDGELLMVMIRLDAPQKTP